MAVTSVAYVATAAQQDYSITFPFLSAAHVFATVDGSASGVTWSISGTTLTFLTPTMTGGEVLLIERITPFEEPLVVFADVSSLRQSELSRSNLQLLYHDQERANLGLQSLTKNVAGNAWVGEALRLTDIADPTEVQDAATKTYVDGLVQQAGVLPDPVGSNGLGIIIRSNSYALAPVSGSINHFQLTPQVTTVVGQFGGFLLVPGIAGTSPLSGFDWTVAATAVPVELQDKSGDPVGGPITVASLSQITVPAGNFEVIVECAARSLTNVGVSFVEQSHVFMAVTDVGGTVYYAESGLYQLGVSGPTATQEFQASATVTMRFIAEFATPTIIVLRAAQNSQGQQDVVIDKKSFITFREVPT